MSTAGTGNQKKVANSATGDIGTGQNLVSQGQEIANSEINSSGGLSPLVAKQLAGENANIQKAYTSAAQANARGLAQRGMSNAPSGLDASLRNSTINNMGQAETGATTGAFGVQNQLNNSALSQPISALNATNGSVNAATGANTAASQMPTTLGNVFGGLSGLSGIAKNVGFGQSGGWGPGQGW